MAECKAAPARKQEGKGNSRKGQFIVRDVQPLSVLNNVGFLHFVEHLDSHRRYVTETAGEQLPPRCIKKFTIFMPHVWRVQMQVVSQ